jgi:hypothetical protein
MHSPCKENVSIGTVDRPYVCSQAEFSYYGALWVSIVREAQSAAAMPRLMIRSLFIFPPVLFLNATDLYVGTRDYGIVCTEKTGSGQEAGEPDTVPEVPPERLLICPTSYGFSYNVPRVRSFQITYSLA